MAHFFKKFTPADQHPWSWQLFGNQNDETIGESTASYEFEADVDAAIADVVDSFKPAPLEVERDPSAPAPEVGPGGH